MLDSQIGSELNFMGLWTQFFLFDEKITSNFMNHWRIKNGYHTKLAPKVDVYKNDGEIFMDLIRNTKGLIYVSQIPSTTARGKPLKAEHSRHPAQVYGVCYGMNICI